MVHHMPLPSLVVLVRHHCSFVVSRKLEERNKGLIN